MGEPIKTKPGYNANCFGDYYYHTAANGACDLWGIEEARTDTVETPGLFTAK